MTDFTNPADFSNPDLGPRRDEAFVKWIPIVVPLGALLLALCVALIDWAVLASLPL
jgi:hypothetical protein